MLLKNTVYELTFYSKEYINNFDILENILSTNYSLSNFNEKYWVNNNEYNDFRTALLQIGEKYAMLTLINNYPCGCRDYLDFIFILNNDYDIIFNKLYISFFNDKLRIILPNRKVGIFEKSQDLVSYTDRELLQIAAIKLDYYFNLDEPKNKNDSFEYTLYDDLFKNINRSFLLKKAFKYLYFKCFRKSFKPGMNQSNILIKMFDNDFKIINN